MHHVNYVTSESLGIQGISLRKRGEYKSQLLALPEAEALQTLSAQLRAARQRVEQQQLRLEQLDATKKSWKRVDCWLNHVEPTKAC